MAIQLISLSAVSYYITTKFIQENSSDLDAISKKIKTSADNHVKSESQIYETQLRDDINKQTASLIEQEKQKYNVIKNNLTTKYQDFAANKRTELQKYALDKSEIARKEIAMELKTMTSTEEIKKIKASIAPQIKENIKNILRRNLGIFYGFVDENKINKIQIK